MSGAVDWAGRLESHFRFCRIAICRSESLRQGTRSNGDEKPDIPASRFARRRQKDINLCKGAIVPTFSSSRAAVQGVVLSTTDLHFSFCDR